ncbi:unnamed protein product [Timema podura]|uniref:Peptidase S1 domain-containing protein n=1 Tax=Timema podura TaxID=61482 RepID=A0ABN7PAP5_TIMPD|nr:unnamed protein product [Timema podura]
MSMVTMDVEVWGPIPGPNDFSKTSSKCFGSARGQKTERRHVVRHSVRTHSLLVQVAFPQIDGRIVGGELANIENYPYQLSYEYDGRHRCGAVIISDTWAVSAAHCTIRY